MLKNEIESEWLDITFHRLHGSSRQRDLRKRRSKMLLKCCLSLSLSIRFDNSRISGFNSHDDDGNGDDDTIGIGIKLENDANDLNFLINENANFFTLERAVV